MAQVGRKHDTGHADSRNSEAQEGAIDDIREVTGLRLNYRDRNLLRVDGVSVMIWNPYEDARPSVVSGVAVGLLVTGAVSIDGLVLGVFGVGATQRIRGIGIGPIGVGSGGSLQQGLANGIVNFAEELHGVQRGLINIAMNNTSGTRVLPVINFHRNRPRISSRQRARTLEELLQLRVTQL